MIALLQRVRRAEVRVDEVCVGKIGPGLLVFLGVEAGDDADELNWLAGKVLRARLFADADGKLNLNLTESGGEILVVSQFSLCARTAKGNRPSFVDAAEPSVAEAFYHQFVAELEQNLGQRIPTGRFAADMEVELVNDGPLTLWIDSRRRR